MNSASRRVLVMMAGACLLLPAWGNPATVQRFTAQLAFEPNRGQTASEVACLAHGTSYTLFLAGNRAVLAFPRLALELSWKGANPGARPQATDPLPGTVNYFVGSDSARWRTAIPRFAKVRYPNLYPGIDLVYYGTEGRLEYDLVVSPGADPRSIHMTFTGHDAARIDRDGDLVLDAAGQEVRQHKPTVYQERDGVREPLGGRYVIRGRDVTFELAKYDPKRPLFIDPVVDYITYLGGSTQEAYGYVAADGQGCAYIAGQTLSADFPLTPGAFSVLPYTWTGYITKLAADGKSLIYSTYFPGVHNYGALQVDGSGDAFITGETNSADFPVTAGAVGPTTGSTFVSKLSADGTRLLMSTRVPGSNSGGPEAMAIDASGAVYVAGTTQPGLGTTSGAWQPSFSPSRYGTQGFIAKIAGDGKSLGYSTYFNGNNGSEITAIAVDNAGNAYITGITGSTDLPVTAGAYQASPGGGWDAFVFKINAAGSAALWGTYLGGTGSDYGRGIAVDNAGNAYATGVSGSAIDPTFPVTANAYRHTCPTCDSAAYIVKFNPNGTVLYSTYIGNASPKGIALDAAGNSYIVGDFRGGDFPTTTDALKRTYNSSTDSEDIAMAKLSADGTTLMYATLFGGSGNEVSYGIAVDSQASIYVSGTTTSTNLPATPGAFQTTAPAGGRGNNFVVKLLQPVPGPLGFHPVTPCRIMDTRGPAGTFGGPPLQGGATRTVPIPQSACNIPDSAQAYSLNVTVVPPAPLMYLSIWPAGQPRPGTSTLNSFDGRIVANAAIVPAGISGAINLFASDTTDAIIDINGYFAPATMANSLSFYSSTPCRIADTRGSTGPLGGPFMSGGSSRSFPIPASSCGAPATAQAYSFNITVVPHGPLWYLTTWPTGQPQPVVSTLNSFDGSIVANAAVVPAGGAGAVSIFVTNDTDVIIDMNGYFAAPGSPGAQSLYPVTPCRVVDTRGNGFSGAFGQPYLAANAWRDFPISSGGCNIPATAQAYSLNATVVPQGPLAYLTAWPYGQAQPMVSTLNSPEGKVVANAAIVPAGGAPSGPRGISVFVTNPTDVILDINGYFAP